MAKFIDIMHINKSCVELSRSYYSRPKCLNITVLKHEIIVDVFGRIMCQSTSKSRYHAPQELDSEYGTQDTDT